MGKVVKKMKKYLSKIGLMLIGFVMVNLVGQTVSANETGGGIGFSVAPVLPTTQIDQNLGYYYANCKIKLEK